MAVHEFKITTTGTQNPVSFADLGMRSFPHPTNAYDLLLEFELDELQRSTDVQAAITAGHITAEDEGGNPITQIEGVGVGWYRDGEALRPVDDGVGFKFGNAAGTEFMNMSRSTGSFNFTVYGTGARALYFNSNQVRHQLGGNAGAESVEISDSGDGMLWKVDSAGVTTMGGRKIYPAASSNPVTPTPTDGDSYFNTTENCWQFYSGAPWTAWVSNESRHAQGMYGMFVHMLEIEAKYSTAQIMTGFINALYRDLSEFDGNEKHGKRG